MDANDEALLEALVGKRRRIFIIATNKNLTFFDLSVSTPELAECAGLLAMRYENRQEPVQVEKRIYSGFYSSNEKAFLENAHRTSQISQTRPNIQRLALSYFSIIRLSLIAGFLFA